MASFNDTMMAFMGIFYAGLGAGQAAVLWAMQQRRRYHGHTLHAVVGRPRAHHSNYYAADEIPTSEAQARRV